MRVPQSCSYLGDMRGLLTGFSSARQGLRLLREHPRLIPFAIIPAVAAVLLSGMAFWLVYRYGFSTRLEGDGWWMTAGVWILRVLEFLPAIVVSSWLVLLLGFPLCDPLTSRAEVVLGAKTRPAPFMEEVMRAVRSTAAILRGSNCPASAILAPGGHMALRMASEAHFNQFWRLVAT